MRRLKAINQVLDFSARHRVALADCDLLFHGIAYQSLYLLSRTAAGINACLLTLCLLSMVQEGPNVLIAAMTGLFLYGTVSHALEARAHVKDQQKKMQEVIAACLSREEQESCSEQAPLEAARDGRPLSFEQLAAFLLWSRKNGHLAKMNRHMANAPG